MKPNHRVNIPMKKRLVIFMVLCFALLQNYTTFSSAKPISKTKKFTYNKFDEGKDKAFFEFSERSSIDLEALQLTPDNENQENGYKNKSGRITYRQPYKLWSSHSQNDDVIASFNTNFIINMFRNDTWEAGEGLAFVIAPSFDLPEKSYGHWLGLTNATIDGKPENHFVAVEFDTRKQDYDPNGHHIGLNVNSVVSNKNVSVDPFEPKANYSVWIEYDGESKLMEVYLANQGEEKPEKPLLSETINLKDYVKQKSYFGFSGSTGDPGIQYNCVLSWELEVEDLDSKNRKPLIIGVSVGVAVMVLVLVLLGIKLRRKYLEKKRRTRDEEANVTGTLKRLPGLPREFKFKELKRATKNFHESMILGEGGFGVVYRGVLHEENDCNGGTNSVSEVAVKKFSRGSINGKEDFLAELTIIHRLRHKHLVRLVGWCYEKGKLLLVYEYMVNGSLEKHLYKSSNESTLLHWNHRYKILTGVASALHYLHNEYDQKVVHRDLKASNILLDSNYNARLGDFGLARALENERNSYAELELGGVPGTMGYVAPECFHTGKATPESDVFGFGAVVLEVVTGRRPGVKIQREEHQFTLVDWVWMLHREGRIHEAVDERLNNEYNVEEANRLLLLGLACSHPIAGERPQTQAICQIIAETLPQPRVPPFKPVFTWPSLSTPAFTSNESSSFSNSTSNSDINKISNIAVFSSH